MASEKVYFISTEFLHIFFNWLYMMHVKQLAYYDRRNQLFFYYATSEQLILIKFLRKRCKFETKDDARKMVDIYIPACNNSPLCCTIKNGRWFNKVYFLFMGNDRRLFRWKKSYMSIGRDVDFFELNFTIYFDKISIYSTNLDTRFQDTESFFFFIFQGLIVGNREN